MSKSKYNLGDFIETVPSCLQTATMALAWEIFSQGHDRLVVLNRQQTPVGVLHLRQLLPQGLTATSNSKNIKQSLSKATAHLLEPLETLPAGLSLEQFQLYLHSRSEGSDNRPIAIVNAAGKFLGLLEQTKLWKFLATVGIESSTLLSTLR